ncbi:MAG: arsenate reductase ArsC, partial [Ignavibacteriae bacterium]|nr:arsenate reductase ArsC [Ignavibacteriota bacterium]
DEANAERCPIFPGVLEKIRWSFPDPSKLGGTKEEKLQQIRIIRDAIKEKVEDWCLISCKQ